MAEARVGSWILWVITTILRIFVVFLRLLWRLAVALLLTGRGLVFAVWNNRIIAGVLIGWFAVGLPMQLFQEEIMTGLDTFWECQIFPTAEFTANAFPLPVVRVPYEEMTEFYNEIALFLVDAIDSAFGDLRTLVRIGKVASVKTGLGSVTEMILGDSLKDFATLWNNIVAALWDYIGGWRRWGIDVVAFGAEMFNTWIIQLDPFSRSCSICSADETLGGAPNLCPIRHSWLPTPVLSDCTECHNLFADFFGLFGGLLDALMGNFVTSLSEGTSFKRIFRAVGCAVRSFFMTPIYIMSSLGCVSFEDVISFEDTGSLLTRWWLAGPGFGYDCGGSDSGICCGNPAGCSFPPPPEDLDLPTGVVPCLGELIAALTDDKFDDFMEMLLGFLFKVIDDVIRTVNRTIECFGQGDADQCFENFPAGGTFPQDEGVCGYNNADVLPDGGLHECFGIIYTCLATNTSTEAPLLEPFIGGILEFLFNDFWRGSVDFAVCPFVTIGPCFSDATDIQKFLIAIEDLKTCSPVWYPIFKPIAVVAGVANDALAIANSANAAANEALEILECLSHCFDGGDSVGELLECFCCRGGAGGCEEGDDDELFDQWNATLTKEQKLQEWHSVLRNVLAVDIDSGIYCGNILKQVTPHDIKTLSSFSDQYMYRACLGMYANRYRTAHVCSGSPANSTADTIGIDKTSWPIADTMRIQSESCSEDNKRTLSKLRENHTKTNLNITIDAFNATVSTGWWTPFSENVKNVSNWRIANTVVPVWRAFQKTRLYTRIETFYTDYSAKLKEDDGSSESRAELDNIYLEFANDILSMKRTHTWRNQSRYNATFAMAHGEPAQYMGMDGTVYQDTTLERLRSLPDQMWSKMEELHVVEPSVNASAHTKAIHANISKSTMATWNVINDATHMEYRPWFSTAAGVVKALRSRDGIEFGRILTGRSRYVASRDEFVSDRQFRREAPAEFTSTGQPKPTLAAVTGQWAVRKATGQNVRFTGWDSRASRKYAPFPLPAPEEGEDRLYGKVEKSWKESAADLISRLHTSKMEERKAAAVERKKQGQTLGEFDANQWLYDVMDGFFAFLGITGDGDTGLINGLVENTKEFWMAFDFKEWTLTNLTSGVERYFSCSIPENIDGTSMHSPWCFGLFREDALTLFSGISATEGEFPTQIPWPSPLVVGNCQTHYNGAGANDIFLFEFSNNCDLDSPILSDSGTCDAVAPCVGNITVTAREVDFFQRTVRYRIVQSGDASCGVESFIMPTPTCANIDDIIIEDDDEEFCNLTGFEQITTDTPGCNVSGPNIRYLVMNISFPVNSSCAFRITYDKSVVFTVPGIKPRVYINTPTAGFEDCTECNLRLPTASCKDPNGGPFVDPFSTKRPLCGEGCDYCERTYTNCAGAGFGDVLDSIFYITGIIPRVGDDLLFSGVDSKVFENWIGPPIVFWALFITLPIVLASCCVCLPLTAIVINISHLLPWTLFIMFGPILPYPFVFFAIAIYAQTRKPVWWELLIWALVLIVSPDIPIAARLSIGIMVLAGAIPAMKKVLRPVFAIIYLTWAIWVLSLIFTFPLLSDVLNINQAIIDILVFLEDWTFLYTAPVVVRAQKYVYPTGVEVPPIDDFCFWWNQGNFALAGLIFIFGSWPLLFFFRASVAFVIWLLELILAALLARLRALRIKMRENLDAAEELAKKNASAVKSIRAGTKDALDKMRARIARKLVSGPQESVLATPSPQPALVPTPSSTMVPLPDESHEHFISRRRAAKEAEEEEATVAADSIDFQETETDNGSGVTVRSSTPSPDSPATSTTNAHADDDSDDNGNDSGPDDSDVETSVITNTSHAAASSPAAAPDDQTRRRRTSRPKSPQPPVKAILRLPRHRK